MRVSMFAAFMAAWLGAAAVPAVAQDAGPDPSSAPPRIQISGGYLLVHELTDLGGTLPRGFFAGIDWTARVGIAAEVRASYGRPLRHIESTSFSSDVSEWSFMAGPRFALGGTTRVRPFAQGLVGVLRYRSQPIELSGPSLLTTNPFLQETFIIGLPADETALSIAPAGGVDVQLPHPGFALRARGGVSFTRLAGDWRTGISFGLGVVVGVIK